MLKILVHHHKHFYIASSYDNVILCDHLVRVTDSLFPLTREKKRMAEWLGKYVVQVLSRIFIVSHKQQVGPVSFL